MKGEGPPKYAEGEIRKESGVYMLYSGGSAPVALSVNGNMLVHETKIDFSGMLGTDSKDPDPTTIRVTATLVGDEIQVYVKSTSKRERKEGIVGTMKRLP